MLYINEEKERIYIIEEIKYLNLKISIVSGEVPGSIPSPVEIFLSWSFNSIS